MSGLDDREKHATIRGIRRFKKETELDWDYWLVWQRTWDVYTYSYTRIEVLFRED